MQQPQATPNAQCALHPGAVATGVCARCGSFMCPTCSDGGTQPMCPRCRAFSAASFPLTRDDFDFSRVWDHAWNSFSREWLMLCVAVIIFGAIAGIGAGISSVFNKILLYAAGIHTDPANPLGNMKALLAEFALGQSVGMVINTVVQSVAMMGLVRVVLDVLVGRKADLGRMFVNLERLPSWVAMMLLQFVIVQVPVLLMIGGTGYAALHDSDLDSLSQMLKSNGGTEHLGVMLLTFAGGSLLVMIFWLVVLPLPLFAGPELLVSGCSPVEAISRAWRMASGHRFAVIGYALMVMLVNLVGLVACCVGALPAFALGNALTCTLFLALRDPSVGPASFE